ncbi:MAG TPA: response regulator [Polyangiaceae bacterium]
MRKPDVTVEDGPGVIYPGSRHPNRTIQSPGFIAEMCGGILGCPGNQLMDMTLPPCSMLTSGSDRLLYAFETLHAATALTESLGGTSGQRDVETDGPSALDAVRARTPDVVLLDLGMPGMDGYDVAATVRRETKLDRVALIALTGRGRQVDLERSVSAGFAHHLMKPANLDELTRAILVTTAG